MSTALPQTDMFMDAADHARIGKQRMVVLRFMLDGEWHTLAEIEAATGFPQASISARLRDFRKPRYGARTVERQRAREGSGTWRYRLA